MKTTTEPTSARTPSTGKATSVAPPPAAPALLDAPAEHLMTCNPVSIRSHASVPEALAMLSDHAFSAVPVINREGHPIGVLSRTDLVRFERERVEFLEANPATFDAHELDLPSGERLDAGFQVEAGVGARVSEVMTPKVLSVLPETPVREVVRLMVEKKVHRLFVVEPGGVLVGVISTMDVLRRLLA